MIKPTPKQYGMFGTEKRFQPTVQKSIILTSCVFYDFVCTNPTTQWLQKENNFRQTVIYKIALL